MFVSQLILRLFSFVGPMQRLRQFAQKTKLASQQQTQRQAALSAG